MCCVKYKYPVCYCYYSIVMLCCAGRGEALLALTLLVRIIAKYAR